MYPQSTAVCFEEKYQISSTENFHFFHMKKKKKKKKKCLYIAWVSFRNEEIWLDISITWRSTTVVSDR